MRLPPDHPLRAELTEEVHARPPEALLPPVRIAFLAVIPEPGSRDREIAALSELVAGSGLAPPEPASRHYTADLGAFRLKWERHTEFSRFMIVAEADGAPPFRSSALEVLPPGWLATLPGTTIAAAQAVLRSGDREPLDLEAISRTLFDGNPLVGSAMAGDSATALTDFRVGPDGLTRFYVEDRGMAPRQAGRTVQRLFEIEAYKTMALLALPVARSLAPYLGEGERELTGIASALATAGEADEATMLDRLTQLEAEMESRAADSQFRFSAAFAYYDLVRSRIAELREARIEGVQTFAEFVDRRLAPAVNTCRATAARQSALSERAARATQLLSTRVEVTRSEQSGELLRSMDRRARLQLRLQETVEGLSVAAVTYYIVGLVGYAAKGLRPFGLTIEPEYLVAGSIPVVLLLTTLGVRRIRKSVAHDA